MSLRVCLKCSTAYAVDLKACPQCGAKTRDAVYDWEDDVVKASEHGATYYVAEGGEVPADLAEGVRLVGPGAPKAEVDAKAEVAEAKAEAVTPTVENKPKRTTKKQDT